MQMVWATCDKKTPESGVFHDLREIKDPEVRLTMFKAVQEFNVDLAMEVDVQQMRQCAKCGVLFTEFIGPHGGPLLFMHQPPEGLMI